MTRFEDRLARTAGRLLGWGLIGGLAACTGTGGGSDGGDTDPPDLSGVCDGHPPPEDYLITTGFVLVEPGADCPADADAQLEVLGCTFLEWQDITCAFSHVDTDQVFYNDGYGGQYLDAATAPTTTGVSPDVVDVCYYDAVFYLPPDHPTCGRPLLREGRAVLAEVRSGPSWASGATPRVDELTAAERQQIGDHWLQSARMEHASIASFACFTLDLMRLGAPPELLAASQRAALDEIAHAELCFSLASGYLGAPVGPGAFDAAPTPSATRLAVAEALVREGCVGETLAALDAAARLAVARDPAVQAALSTIYRDESAHAALAWRALAWMLEQDRDGALREHLARVFAEERSKTAALEDTATVSAGALAHGLVSARTRRDAFDRGWDEVIGPSWAAMRAARSPGAGAHPAPALAPPLG